MPGLIGSENIPGLYCGIVLFRPVSPTIWGPGSVVRHRVGTWDMHVWARGCLFVLSRGTISDGARGGPLVLVSSLAVAVPPLTRSAQAVAVLETDTV